MLPAAIAHPLYQPARLLCLHLFLHIHLPASFGSLCSPWPVLPSCPGYPSPMSPDVSTLLICSSHLSGRSSSLPLPPVPSAGFLPRFVQVLAKSSPLPTSSPLSSHISPLSLLTSLLYVLPSRLAPPSPPCHELHYVRPGSIHQAAKEPILDATILPAAFPRTRPCTFRGRLHSDLSAVIRHPTFVASSPVLRRRACRKARGIAIEVTLVLSRFVLATQLRLLPPNCLRPH
jgi:hypothetical protein